MKKLWLLLLLLPLLAQAQISTYSLSWNSVPVSPATSVIGYCSINDGTYFQTLTVPTIQNMADVIVNLNPGDKIACYASTTDGINYSPSSNLAVAYEPMQIGSQLCVAGGTGVYKVSIIYTGNTTNAPLYSLSSWENYSMLRQNTASMSTAFIMPGTLCDPAMVLALPGVEFHQATNASGITGLAVCQMQ